MAPEVASAATRLLREWQQGSAEAGERLAPLIYAELRRLAAAYLRRERDGHTLQATALVHEAYLHLVEQRSAPWQSRAHFVAIAACQMRRILVDHARQRSAAKRSGGQRLTLADDVVAVEDANLDLLLVDEALGRLSSFDPRQSRVVELRFFGGLNIDETAEALRVSPATVKREWTLAKAWLQRELSAEPGARP